MRLYFAGWQASRRKRELEVIQRGNVKHRCYSFANLVKIPGFPYFIKGFEGSYQASLENNVGIFMDSGVISYRNYRLRLQKLGKDKELKKMPDVETFIQMYVEYCKENGKKWDWYATTDMTRVAKENYPLHVNLLKQGIEPVPVFHGDSSIDWIKKYHDLGHKFIAIGSHKTMRASRKQLAEYLHAVFNIGAKLGITYHGLAMTSPWIMLSYPWGSVDSSWWSRSAGYGSIMLFHPTNYRMSILHVSERTSDAKGVAFKQNTIAMGQLKEQLIEEGFDLAKLRTDFTERHVLNARSMMKLCDEATRRHGTKEVGKWNQLF